MLQITAKPAGYKRKRKHIPEQFGALEAGGYVFKKEPTLLLYGQQSRSGFVITKFCLLVILLGKMSVSSIIPIRPVFIVTNALH